MQVCPSIDLTILKEFLQIPTPNAWLEQALKQTECLLVDHAHLERKAAHTALTLMARYPEKNELLIKLSPLAREELLHFEKVISLLNKRKIPFLGLKPSAYAKELHALASNKEPLRLIDSLIIGSIIEARSCERFSVLIPHLDDELAVFYHSLLKSEARHFGDYLDLAHLYGERAVIDERLFLFLEKENELICSQDPLFRFHSGVPTST